MRNVFKIVQGGPLRFLKLQFVAKCEKNEGFGDIKNFSENEIFEQCHSGEICKKGTLWNFLASILLQIIETIEGGLFGVIRKLSEKNLIVPKKIQVKNIKKVWWTLGMLSRLWTWLLFFFVLEDVLTFPACFGYQVWEIYFKLNKWTKKWTLRVFKKTTHCNSRAHFLLK